MEEWPPFKYERQKLGHKLAASVSNVLDIAGISSVLWGEMLMNVHGVPYIVDDLGLVIPDGDLDHAYRVLHERGFLTCSMGKDCSRSPESNIFRSYPAAPRHLHLDEHGGLALVLHRKSETLWTLPTFVPLSINKNPEAKIILASDQDGVPMPNRTTATGAFSESLFPVRIPSAHCLMEACMLLMERDFDENSNDPRVSLRVKYDWDRMILSMLIHGGGHPHPPNPEYMDPRCRELYQYFNTDTKEHKAKGFGTELDILLRLRKSMQESR